MRLFTSFLIFILSLQVFAQNSGFYRVQNHKTSRYITVIDNKGGVDIATTDADLGALITLKGFDNVVSKPGAIIYIENVGNSNYNLKSQGIDTYSIINYYIKLKASRSVKGAYQAYAQASGIVKYLCDEDWDGDDGAVMTSGTKTRDWYLHPITADGDNYFGLKPGIATSKGHFQTFYASFAYQLPANMKAYYVDRVEKGMAVWKEVKDGLVPAATPVIIQSNSAEASKNRLTLLTSASTKVSGNLLKGVYFCNDVKGKHNNVVAYNAKTMRVLGKMANGDLGFITDANLKNIPENTAYITVAEGAPAEIKLVTEDEIKTPATHTITYIVDGAVYEQQTVEAGKPITPPTAPAKKGYTFVGWSGMPQVMPDGNISVEAQFKVNSYTITYMIDGAVVSEQTVEYGAMVTAPAAPEKTGHTFKGWTNVPTTMPAENFTVTGAYEVNKYTLTFTIDGAVVSEQTVEYGAKVTAPAAPEKTGHTFKGWTNVPTTMPAENVTVTGAYEVNKYTLTFTIDGAIVSEQTVEYGASVTAPAAPEKKGHTFKGWTNVPTTMPAENVTVTGAYEVNKYTLTFTIDGAVVSEQTVEYGASITAPAAPEKEGHTFKGWTNVPTTMPAENVTVTGAYTKNKYLITFKVDDEVIHTDSVEYGAVVNAPENPTKEGYTFSGWQGLPNTMPAEDVTVTANFIMNGYTLTYVVDGEVYRTYAYEYGSTITPEQAPQKEGHTFSGWSEIPGTMPAEDVTITGSFTVNKYLVTFKIGEEVIQADSLTYGSTIVAPNAPAKEGHTFKGWEGMPETVPAADVTAHGVYEVNKYKLTYILDGEVYEEQMVEYGTSINPIEVELEEGKTFEGWQEVPETMPANDVVVYGTTTVSSITAVNGTNALSDVYSLTGRLIAKGVDATWIRTNLKTGIYIINNKKVMIK